MSKENIWAFLDAIEIRRLNVNQNEDKTQIVADYYNNYQVLQDAKKRFEVGVSQCFAEKDYRTLSVVKDRLDKFIFERSNNDDLVFKLNSIAFGKQQAEANRVNNKMLCELVSEASNYINDFLVSDVNEDYEDSKADSNKIEPDEQGQSPDTSTAEELLTISGTKGLGDYLGCGKTTAFKIIKDGILKENGIQYMVGKCWKFNREKLDKALRENPKLLAKYRLKE